MDQSLAPLAAASLVAATIGLMRGSAERPPRSGRGPAGPGVVRAPDPPAPRLVHLPEGTSYAGPVLGTALASRSTRVGQRSRWMWSEESFVQHRPDDACDQCGWLCTVLLRNGWEMYAEYEDWTELSCAWCDAGSPLGLAAAWDGERWILPLPATSDATLRREAVDVAADQFVRALGDQRPGLAPPTHDRARTLWATSAQYRLGPEYSPWGRRVLLVELLNPRIDPESATRHLAHLAGGDPWVPATLPVPSLSRLSAAYDRLVVETQLLESELLALPRIDRNVYTGREWGLFTSWDVTPEEPVLRCWARPYVDASDRRDERHDWLVTMDGAFEATAGSPSDAFHSAFTVCDLPANERWFLLRSHLLRNVGQTSPLWEPPRGLVEDRSMRTSARIRQELRFIRLARAEAAALTYTGIVRRRLFAWLAQTQPYDGFTDTPTPNDADLSPDGIATPEQVHARAQELAQIDAGQR